MIDIDWKTFVEDVNKWINRRIGQTRNGAQNVVREAAQIVNTEIRESIREANAVASGDLLESVTTNSMQSSTDMVEVTVGSSSPYASYVEHGRRAGSKAPPTDAIMDWMVAKGLEPDSRSAYLIARKIARDGIPPKKVFERGAERAERKMGSRLEIVMDKSLDED